MNCSKLHFCVNKNNCAAVRPYPGLPMIIITVYVLCDRPIDESSINYGNYYIFLEWLSPWTWISKSGNCGARLCNDEDCQEYLRRNVYMIKGEYNKMHLSFDSCMMLSFRTLKGHSKIHVNKEKGKRYLVACCL